MKFSDRSKLEEEYYKWIHENRYDLTILKDLSLNIITFLDERGFLKESNNFYEDHNSMTIEDNLISIIFYLYKEFCKEPEKMNNLVNQINFNFLNYLGDAECCFRSDPIFHNLYNMIKNSFFTLYKELQNE